MQFSDENQAETLLQAYRGQRQVKQQAEQSLKALSGELEALAARHPEWFASRRTRTFTHGKLAWVQRAELALPQDFDIEIFYTLFPQCVRLLPSLSGVQQSLADERAARALEQLGVRLVHEPQFIVKV
ncbi:MAG: hypothetical protein KF690_01105 [Bacteroidetes bacterium]|nr:hypothetical protein [Bacteroidota bacterium]